jgi:hypothetical protein
VVALIKRFSAYTNMSISRMVRVSWGPVKILEPAALLLFYIMNIHLQHVTEENYISSKRSLKVADRHRLQQINPI